MKDLQRTFHVPESYISSICELAYLFMGLFQESRVCPFPSLFLIEMLFFPFGITFLIQLTLDTACKNKGYEVFSKHDTEY